MNLDYFLSDYLMDKLSDAIREQWGLNWDDCIIAPVKNNSGVFNIQENGSMQLLFTVDFINYTLTIAEIYISEKRRTEARTLSL